MFGWGNERSSVVAPVGWVSPVTDTTTFWFSSIHLMNMDATQDLTVNINVTWHYYELPKGADYTSACTLDGVPALINDPNDARNNDALLRFGSLLFLVISSPGTAAASFLIYIYCLF